MSWWYWLIEMTGQVVNWQRILVIQERTTSSIDQIIDEVQICLETTYFFNDGKFYRQLHGYFMGSPISPLPANLVVENFELQALYSYASTSTRLWPRYIDDTLIINRTEQADFFEHINSINSHIRFTQEKYLDNKLAFLDCNIKISDARTENINSSKRCLIWQIIISHAHEFFDNSRKWS